jgi:hypothetical protein
MSIWTDCEEYNAVPFYGFPVKPSFDNDIITFEFPIGYEPNESQTKKVAQTLQKMFRGKILEITDKIVKVKLSKNSLSNIIYEYYLDNANDFE